MYKTIRHGENSLQYTILPQNDDIRIEGKLTTAESSCSSGRKPKTKRPRKRSFFAYLGILFVCTVIVGAVLIPFLVSANCLLNPTDWFLSKNGEKHNKPMQALKNHGNIAYNNAHNNYIGNGINIGKTVKIINQSGIEKVLLRINKTSSNATENLKSHLILRENVDANDAQNGNDIQIEKEKFKDDNTSPLINIVQSNDAQNEIYNNGIDMRNDMHIQEQSQNKKTNAQFEDDINEKLTKQTKADSGSDSNQSNQNLMNNFAENPANEHFVTEVRFEPIENVSTKPRIVPTIVVTTLRNQLNNNDLNLQQAQQQQQEQQPLFVQSQTAPNVRQMNLSSSITASMNNASNSTTSSSSLLTRIIQVPLLKAAAKKPIIPPVLVKTNSQLGTANGVSTFVDGNLDAVVTQSPLDRKDNPNISSADVRIESLKRAQRPKFRGWIPGHWPFVDSNTYFPWNGYKTEDSVLWPALLGFFIVGVILFISVCLVARNKRTIVSSVRKRNRNGSDVEENDAEDNTTLLTTASLSDED